jgi:hypothetical protein
MSDSDNDNLRERCTEAIRLLVELGLKAKR